ncbi:ankyrin repeat domain-containing protein 13D isoform X2 [Manduca sexta]|uniref:ankyrin repeat domain-containing protein 13D isoform X2 n=1 Tax=Manduca sexta TaxID=7130 RepID=UPI0011840A94|nr:ankyrin repeat domain-containing protein 13D isoform X2 [Manduca sexta]
MMALSAEEVARRYPLHWLVWNNNHEELKSSLEANKYTSEELELKDPRGRTPLLLAVTLGHIEAVRALIDAGADVNCEKDGWTAVQEATSTGDPALLSLVLSRRDYQRHVLRSGGIPDLLHKLSMAPDFYVEMKWEFTSWVPLVSRMCPFDTYKLYKRGGNVRVDTTLVGFENNCWQRGDRTYIFRGQGRTARLMELDHEAGTMWCEYVEPVTEARAWPEPSAHALDARLAQPTAINYLDTDNISFQRNKSGIWGWRQDKTEVVNGYECKVFGANNVQLVSKTRSEHLARAAHAHPQHAAARAPLADLLAFADDAADAADTHASENTPPSSQSSEDLTPVTWEEYFSGEAMEKDIGRPKEITTKVQKFKATLWLCEDYPLELQEQIMPILDLMAAISSPHFAKLKDFVQMQLPAGFPVKIEIPLFHVLNARITFGNIFARDTPVPHVQWLAAGGHGARPACVLDDGCFALGAGYRDAAAARHAPNHDEALLQYAIQQSLMEAGTHDDQVDVWEALRGARPSSPMPPRSQDSPQELLAHEERQLQRAIEASLAAMTLPPASPLPEPSPEPDPELQAALALSAREQLSRQQQLDDEQRALDEALRLSLIDK